MAAQAVAASTGWVADSFTKVREELAGGYVGVVLVISPQYPRAVCPESAEQYPQ